MAKTVSDTRVLQATSQPNMLVSSQLCHKENLIFPHRHLSEKMSCCHPNIEIFYQSFASYSYKI